jgi:hypothetical protein
LAISEDWRSEYRRRRYLGRVKDEEVRARLRYLMENLTTLEPNGKKGVLPADSSLWRAFTETHEETLLRGHLNLDGFLNDAAIPTPTYPSSSLVTAAYRRRRDKREGQFVVFKGSR